MADDPERREQTERALEQIAYARVQADVHWIQILTRISERIEQEASTIADRKVLADEIRDMAERLRKDFRVQILTRITERIEREAATIADRKVLADEIRDIADRLRKFWIEQDQARQKR